MITLHEIPKKGTISETESRLMATWDGHGRWEGRVNVHEGSCWRNENALKMVYDDDCTIGSFT